MWFFSVLGLALEEKLLTWKKCCEYFGQEGVQYKDESCQEFGGQTVLQIEAVHNLHKVHMYLNVLSLRSTS